MTAMDDVFGDIDQLKRDVEARAAAEAARPHDAPLQVQPGVVETSDMASGAVLIEAAQRLAKHDAAAMYFPDLTGAATAGAYHPVSPFRLTFEIEDGEDGEETISSIEVHDPIFIWQYYDGDGKYHADEKTAAIRDDIPTSGSIYLNLTLEEDPNTHRHNGKLSSSSVGDKDDGADAWIRLYEISEDGAIKDFRHALITLGIGAGPSESESSSSAESSWDSSPGSSSWDSSPGSSSGSSPYGSSSGSSPFDSSPGSSPTESSPGSSQGSSPGSSQGSSPGSPGASSQGSESGPESWPESEDESDESDGVEVVVDVKWECPQIVMKMKKLRVVNGKLVSTPAKDHYIMTTPHTEECCDCHK